MGAKSSHPHSHGAVQAVVRMQLPNDNPPYPGPPVRHSFMKTKVIISSSFTSVTSNVDQVYPSIAQQLSQGQQLLTFCRIPGSAFAAGFASFSLTYLAIFRNKDPDQSPNTLLQVVKSTTGTEYIFTGLLGTMQVDNNKAAVYAAIQEKAAQGARLICMETTGQSSIGCGGGQAGDMVPVLGVDVFFEVPPTPGPQQFVYELLPVPLRRIPGFGSVRVECDWMGALRSKLNQGWRLVDIFFGSYRDYQEGIQTIVTYNTQWFFEKPVAKLHDPTPVWESCFGEIFVKLKTSFGGVKAQTDWDGYICAMGDRGWELVCIVDTPEVRRSGFTMEQKCLIFFQRRILPPLTAPPSYDPKWSPTGQPAPGTEASHQGVTPAPGGFVVPPEGQACAGKEQEALGFTPVPGSFVAPPVGQAFGGKEKEALGPERPEYQ